MVLSRNKMNTGPIILIVLLFGFFLRLFFAITYLPLLGDEQAHLIVAKNLSFSKDHFYFPLENILQNHLILTDLPVKIGIALFGENYLGARMIFVVIGFFNLIAIYKLLSYYSKEAAIYALGLLTINEFHIGHSGLAANAVITLLLSTISIYLFWKGVNFNKRVLWLLAPVWILSYLAHEGIIVFVPIFYLYLLISPRYRIWLKSKEVNFSYIVFFALIIFHLFCIKSFGTSLEFYATKGYVQPQMEPVLTGINFFLIKPICKILNIEYLMTVNWEVPLMSALSGIVLFSGTMYSFTKLRDDFIRLLLMLACSQLVAFTFINTVGFNWGEADWARLSFIPAIGLTAIAFHRVSRRWKYSCFLIYLIFIIMLFQSSIFSFQQKNVYPPHRFATFVDYDVQFIYLYLDKDFPSRPGKEELEKIGIKTDYGMAVKESMKALRICPNEVRIHMYLAESLYKLGDKKSSKKIWLKALELEPFYMDTFDSVVTSYSYNSDFLESINNYKNGITYLNENQPQMAISEFLKNLEMTTEQALPHFYIGMAHLIEGNITLAQDNFLEALKRNSDFVHVYIGLAKTYLLQNKLDHAEDILKKALIINPDSSLAYQYIGKLYELKGDPKLAKAHYVKAKNIIHVTLQGYANRIQSPLGL